MKNFVGLKPQMFSQANLSMFTVLAIAASQLYRYSLQLAIQVQLVASYRYTIQPQSYTLWCIWITLILHALSCKMLLQLVSPYTDKGVAMQVWNYVLLCLPVLKTVVICSFNCLIALEAKYHLSNDSNFVIHFMTCMLNKQTFTMITGPIEPVDPIQFSSLVMGHLSSSS